MQHSHDTSAPDEQVGSSARTHTPAETAEEDSFSDRTIKAQISAEVARIRSAWLQRNAEGELTGSSFSGLLVDMLVDTLDAHAKGYLSLVHREEQIPRYLAKLRRLGEGLYEEAKQNTQLTIDGSSPNQTLSPEFVRDFLDRSLTDLLAMSDPGFSPSTFQTAEAKQRRAHKVAVATKLVNEQLAKDVERWRKTRDEILFQIETRFSGRYQYWQAEALEQVRAKENDAGPTGVHPVGVSNWEDVEIEFLSDERVRVRIGNRMETLNYAEMGFADKRDGKPNHSWVILRTIAQLGGILADSAAARKKWPAVEKHIQRIRKALREHFGLGGDPLLFVKGTGYSARFKIGRAASFDT